MGVCVCVFSEKNTICFDYKIRFNKSHQEIVYFRCASLISDSFGTILQNISKHGDESSSIAAKDQRHGFSYKITQ